MIRLIPIFALLVSISLLPTAGLADDWPQWRGPERDGVWRESGIVEKFASDKLPLVWEAEISSGYSGPTVAEGRVYVSDRVTDPKQIERVLCFDAKTGKQLWVHEYDCPYRNVSYRAGPRACVTLDEGRAYSLGTMGDLYCLNGSDGKVIWQKDLDKLYEINMPIWGISAAPLIEGELLIVQAGGKDACLVAFNKTTGEEVWKALSDLASYAAPIIIKQAGKRVLVCWTGDNVVGLDPTTGDVHWKQPFKPSKMVLAVSTPVLEQDRLFVTGFYDGSMMLKLPSDELAADLLWRRKGASEKETDSLHSIIATPYLEGDHIYGVDSYGELRCLEAETGDRLWVDLTATNNVRWGNIHMVKHDDQIWMFNERGELLITELSPEGYKELSRAKLIDPTREQLNRRDGVCWAHPAFANQCVFARSDEKLVCASLAK